MALLNPGEYSLHQDVDAVRHHSKSLIFVKFTDSAQRALNDYLRNGDFSQAPAIEFNAEDGRFSIPGCAAQFTFDIVSNEAIAGRQGRFECVHQGPKRTLQQLGQPKRRLIVRANEDVYETTKNRMAAIELKQRQNCTQRLDWNSSTMNRNRGGAGNRVKPQPSSAVTSSAAATVAATAIDDPSIRSKSRPTAAPPQRINPAACIIRKPLRERIIHLLAVKPYKTNDLLAILKRDGIRDCDRPNLNDVLAAVAVVRDNQYHLAKHLWNDVQEDWLFYTDHERQLIRKNKAKNVTSPSANSDSGISVTSNQSPGPNNAAGGGNCTPYREADNSPQQAYKRPGYIEDGNGFHIKRQRISHFTRPEQPAKSTTTNVSGPIDSDEPKPAKSATAQTKPTTRSIFTPDREYSRKSVPTVIVSSPELSSTTNGHDQKLPPPEQPSKSSLAASGGGVTATGIVRSHQTVVAADSTSSSTEVKYQKPKYMKEYVTITSLEQRRKYKQDFSEIFKEYQMVHEEVDSISNTFARLGESLKQHKKGTPKYHKIEAEIFKKYFALKANPKFQAAKKRFEYLHEKLSHIKQLVHEYDQKMLK